MLRTNDLQNKECKED